MSINVFSSLRTSAGQPKDEFKKFIVRFNPDERDYESEIVVEVPSGGTMAEYTVDINYITVDTEEAEISLDEIADGLAETFVDIAEAKGLDVKGLIAQVKNIEHDIDYEYNDRAEVMDAIITRTSVEFKNPKLIGDDKFFKEQSLYRAKGNTFTFEF